MVYFQNKTVTTGQLLSDTFSELAMIRRELGLYFLAFGVASILSQLITVLDGLIGLVTALGYFAAQYALYRALLRKSGFSYDDNFKIFSFFFMAILLGIAIYFGFAIFVIPGILLAAKWIMAPSYLVAEDMNLFEAIGASWRASGNNLLSLSLGFVALSLSWLVLFFVFVGITEAIGQVLAEAGAAMGKRILTGVGLLFGHVLPILLMGLSMSAYRALSDQTETLTDVFE